MKKIRLDLDALRVESFATAEAPRRGGTVHGHAPSYFPEPCAPTDRVTDCNDVTCAWSCNGYTCEPTAANTCAATCTCASGQPSCLRWPC